MATRDPEATKQRILAAALHEFSAKGISGARVDAIAQRAKVNKRMLYYYFGSKDGLFREILRRRVDESAAALQTGDVASADRLASSQRNLASDTEYVRLLAWEALEMRPHQPVNESIRRRFFRSWIEAIEAEQRAGRLPADLDAAQLVLSEVCLVLGPMVMPQITRLVTGRTLSNGELLDRRCGFLTTLARRLDAPT
jgi:TetR/AcrR family transcriptional regulator